VNDDDADCRWYDQERARRDGLPQLDLPLQKITYQPGMNSCLYCHIGRVSADGFIYLSQSYYGLEDGRPESIKAHLLHLIRSAVADLVSAQCVGLQRDRSLVSSYLHSMHVQLGLTHRSHGTRCVAAESKFRSR